MSELHRFARQLVESLSSHDPTALGSPVSLEEITTRVLPYRACRRLFGILNVEDYELLLLRLVAGEGGLAAGAPLAAVERCRAELDTGHPDPGVLNELEGATLRLDLGAIALGEIVTEEPAGSIVRSYTLAEPEAEAEPELELEAGQELRPSSDSVEFQDAEVEEAPEEEAIPSSERVDRSVEQTRHEAVEFDFLDTPAPALEESPLTPEPAGADPEPEPEADPFQELFDAPGDVTEPAELSESPPPAITAPPEPVAPPPPAAHGEPPPRCPHCASRLPSGRPVRFCPHCGSNVVPLQCVSCGAALEPAWRHCVLCGAPAVNDSRFA
ncbi:MAG TPA: zinc ribbon domain-containing protein [Gemmatimonadales bacterium]|nr:zinc ribbon domain-containing protein [Gemmatimonadales bacterium]